MGARTFPNGTCTMAAASVRNCTVPFFCSDTALPMSGVSVPMRGFGISFLGPRI